MAVPGIEVFRRSDPDIAELDEVIALGPDDTLTPPLLPGFELIELTVGSLFSR